MKSLLSLVILAIGMLTLTGCVLTPANSNPTWAALAIDSNQGRAYGLSYDYPTEQEASARALKECGNGCRVVKTFAAGCGAFAADQSRNSTITGWGTASTEAEAKKIALNYCKQYGGTSCIVRVQSCNSHFVNENK